MAVRFALDGDLRFLSHQESMRLFARAAVRARLPLAWGLGFNPRPRFSLPLPRPVGVATCDDLLVLDLDVADDPSGVAAPPDPRQVRDRLSEQLPPGVRLLDAAAISRMPRPTRVRYAIALPGEPAGDDLSRRVAALLARDRCILSRTLDARGRTRPIDIRPYIEHIQWDCQSARLVLTLRLEEGGTARPGEVLGALGLDPAELLHRVEREWVDWRIEWNNLPENKGV